MHPRRPLGDEAVLATPGDADILREFIDGATDLG